MHYNILIKKARLQKESPYKEFLEYNSEKRDEFQRELTILANKLSRINQLKDIKERHLVEENIKIYDEHIKEVDEEIDSQIEQILTFPLSKENLDQIQVFNLFDLDEVELQAIRFILTK